MFMPSPRGPVGNQPNMQQLLKQAQKMQAELASAQEKLAEARVEGSAGGGLVRATATGSGEIVALVIDPSVIDPTDEDLAETLADLVLAAVRDASEAATKLQQSTMGPLTSGLPGLM
jgi:DNA-binding YbaB/EbfC family protein